MALHKRARVSAEFSMASMTDVIFLLLIFFMLTSNFVRIQPFDLPESDSKTVAATSVIVQIDRFGTYTLNNAEVDESVLEVAVRNAVAELDETDRENTTVTIVAEKGVPFERVTQVMNIAARLRARAIIATQPRL